MRKLRYICLFVSFFLIPNITVAANYYIRQGATGNGNGSDWTNAFNTLPSTLIRGDTYFIADGTYGTFTFDDPESGSTYTHIKKATIASHGTDIGWQSSYGDGQAIIQGTGTVLNFRSGYWDFDGVLGQKEGSSEKHGFVVYRSGSGDSNAVDFNASNIYLRHTEVYDENPCNLTSDNNSDGLYSAGDNATNITIQYCYIHDIKRCGLLFSGTSNIIVEHSYFLRNYSTAGSHGQAMFLWNVTNFTIRYNTFENINGSAIIFNEGTNDNVQIYGNLFQENVESADCGIFSVNYIVDTNSSSSLNNSEFHHNTAVGLVGRANSGGVNADNGSGNTAYNNIFYDCDTYFGNFLHDYNASDDNLNEINDQIISSTIFTNYVNNNFKLSSNTDPGLLIAETYNTDMFGNPRTTRTRGAYEFNDGGPPPEIDIATPTGFKIVQPTIAVSSVSASSHDGNLPQNTLDNNLETRWSAFGIGQWIEYDLGAEVEVSRALISFYIGDQRTSNLSIQVSINRISWNEVYNGNSSGTTIEQENFSFNSSVNARYIRIIGNGNSDNTWNSITEVDIL